MPDFFPQLKPKCRDERQMGNACKFLASRPLIRQFTMPTFVVSELTARSAARPVGDVGDTPGHFYAHIQPARQLS